MSEEMARGAIDWLHGTTCRVLALMGGEVLLRPKFVHKIVDYAAAKGFWIYIPTNGRLLKPGVIDRLADAGVATFNLAVDAVEGRLYMTRGRPRPHSRLYRTQEECT